MIGISLSPRLVKVLGKKEKISSVASALEEVKKANPDLSSLAISPICHARRE